MTLLWVLFWVFIAGHLLCCCVGANDWKLRGYVLGLILFFQITQFANSAEHSVLVNSFDLNNMQFSISAQSDGEILTIVPNTCGSVSHVEVITDPPHTGITETGGLYKAETSATRGVFRCVVCENNRCTPVEIFFTGVEVIGGNTPTGVGVSAPRHSVLFYISVSVAAVCFLLCVGYLYEQFVSAKYDEDQYA